MSKRSESFYKESFENIFEEGLAQREKDLGNFKIGVDLYCRFKNYYDLGSLELFNKSRKHELVRVRDRFFYAFSDSLEDFSGAKNPTFISNFSGFDHSTVYHSTNKNNDIIDSIENELYIVVNSPKADLTIGERNYFSALSQKVTKKSLNKLKDKLSVMRRFKSYASPLQDSLEETFSLEEGQLFEKTRLRRIMTPRHFFSYLCWGKNMDAFGNSLEKTISEFTGFDRATLRNSCRVVNGWKHTRGEHGDEVREILSKYESPLETSKNRMIGELLMDPRDPFFENVSFVFSSLSDYLRVSKEDLFSKEGIQKKIVQYSILENAKAGMESEEALDLVSEFFGETSEEVYSNIYTVNLMKDVSDERGDYVRNVLHFSRKAA